MLLKLSLKDLVIMYKQNVYTVILVSNFLKPEK